MKLLKESFSLICLFFSLSFWILSSKESENNLLKKVLRKFILYLEGINFMLFSRDSKNLNKVLINSDDISKSKEIISKTIIFIRHGESDWNEVFNKGLNLMIFIRLFKAMYRELLLYPTDDSIFLDSPLNHDGFNQALELRKYIKDTATNLTSDQQNDKISNLFAVLRGDNNINITNNRPVSSSIIVTSNLRRAISTCTTALFDRILKNKEKICINSSLQEIALNVDTKALSEPKGLPDLSRMSHYLPEFGSDYAHFYDTTDNLGNKTISNNGLKRIKSFSEYIFSKNEDVIITSGHSLYFKYFFHTYLSPHSKHIAKTHKIVNSGVVSFTIKRGLLDNNYIYSIEEDSITVLYGGFEHKKK